MPQQLHHNLGFYFLAYHLKMASAVPGAELPKAVDISAELISQISGDWKLDSGASDSIEPLLKMMGVPWMVRKAALAAPAPSQHVELSAKGMIVQTEGFAKVRNEYTWGSGNTHNTPSGAFPASLALDSTGKIVILHVDAGDKGTIETQYSFSTEGGKRTLTLQMTLTPRGAAVEHVRRVFRPKA
jgi:hypothetical protein